jgi:hypothetical protein
MKIAVSFHIQEVRTRGTADQPEVEAWGGSSALSFPLSVLEAADTCGFFAGLATLGGFTDLETSISHMCDVVTSN